MIEKNKFENALNAIHSTFILSRKFAYEKRYDEIIKNMELSISLINLFLNKKNKTKEFEKELVDFTKFNNNSLSIIYFENPPNRKSYFRNYKKLTNNALIELRKLARETINMVEKNINYLKIAKFLDDIEYLVTLMLLEENKIKTFDEYLNEIIDQSFKRNKIEIENSRKRLVVSLLEIGVSIEKISKTTKIHILEIKKIKKDNNL